MIVNKDGESWGNLCGWFGNAQGTGCQRLSSQHNTLRDGRTFGFALDLLLQKVFFYSLAYLSRSWMQRFTTDIFFNFRFCWCCFLFLPLILKIVSPWVTESQFPHPLANDHKWHRVRNMELYFKMKHRWVLDSIASPTGYITANPASYKLPCI